MNWQEQSFTRLEAAFDAGPVVAVLPLGAVEAHGPHLPVGTDVWIAEAMARAGAEKLGKEGLSAVVLPSLAYAPAPFANAHPGTLSIRPETLTALVVDLASAVAARGIAVLALANAHFDPAQVAALRKAVEELRNSGRLRVAFPDLTRRRLAERLGEEFRSGACHAGRYESSILLATRPDLVDDAARLRLPSLPVSLVEAAGRGERTFVEAGLEMAYCGDPAAASAEEGRVLVAELGAILAEAVQAELG
ncbi:MAG: creatininase family protein [Thermoanaerobaculia bacterium]|nr:creatininase family protein [Thermoanaerobaculia bacterium]